MAFQLGDIVGKIGKGELIRDALNKTITGSAYFTLREITVTRESFVAAQVTDLNTTGTYYGDPAPEIRISAGGAVKAEMTPSVSKLNYTQPFRVTAILGAGKYQIQATAGTSRQVRLNDLIISITPT